MYCKHDWSWIDCANLYCDIALTPYSNKQEFFKHFVRHVLGDHDLILFGWKTSHIPAARIGYNRIKSKLRRMRESQQRNKNQ